MSIEQYYMSSEGRKKIVVILTLIYYTCDIGAYWVAYFIIIIIV